VLSTNHSPNEPFHLSGRLVAGPAAILLMLLFALTMPAASGSQPSVPAAQAQTSSSAGSRVPGLPGLEFDARGNITLAPTGRPAEDGSHPSAPVSVSQCGLEWRILEALNSSEGTPSLSGVAALSPSNVWGAGGVISTTGTYHTLIAHWNGSTWLRVPSPSPSTRYNYLVALAALSANDVWAVGHHLSEQNSLNTLTMHWDGTHWSVVPSPNLPTTFSALFSLAAITSNDVWAVGYGSLAIHWDGMQWTTVPTPNLGPNSMLFGITALSANDVWATGQYDAGERTETVALHWDGLSWTVVPTPNVGPLSNTLFRVAAVSTNDVWAAGYYVDELLQMRRTLVLHWDGTQWTVVPSPNSGDPSIGNNDNSLYAIAAVSSNDVWAVGDHFEGQVSETLVEHWDGTQWTVVPSPNSGDFENHLEGISAISGGDIWAVGVTSGRSNPSQVLVERYNDPCITPTPTPNGCSLCNLSVRDVSVECNPDGTVHWTATVRNSAACDVYTAWESHLQVKRSGGGQFEDVLVRSGSSLFPPGETTLEGDICYLFSPDTRLARIEFAPLPTTENCKPHGRSPAVASCVRNGSCP
jgi:hypothetical protein